VTLLAADGDALGDALTVVAVIHGPSPSTRGS
jgi:hypothetical protein